MANLTRASQELFRRHPDEFFPTLQALWEHANQQKERSQDRWQLPQTMRPVPIGEALGLKLSGDDGAFLLNDWSFTQLCRMASVGKETLNRLSADTASRVFQETLPIASKPSQLLTAGETVRSIHGTVYTRLWNVDVLAMLREFATDFGPPPEGFNGATGLYAGEQDMFCFLIDAAGWAEIDGQAFAPGFFVWNSEVGRRTLGIQTFWFEQICQNHIVWDAVDVVSFTAKHTSKVHEGLGQIRRHIEALVGKRDERRDGFVRVIGKAMKEKLGDDADEVLKALTKHGFSQGLGRQAVKLVEGRKERFTIFAVVDALTRMARELPNAGDRTEADEKASSLLSLVA
jgi:hypothetical protein